MGVSGSIIVIPTITILDSKNTPRTCRICINTPSVYPEVAVIFSGVDDPFLCNDTVFVENVMNALRGCGYEGEAFYRSAMGRQEENIVVLEGGDAFANWARKKYGWEELKVKP
jgi:hypothetical protein